MKKKYIIVIPAREGSKRLPNKNLSKIGKKSLLEIKLMNCLHKNLGPTIVTSDDKKILSSAKKMGVKFLRERPLSLKGDVPSTLIAYDAVKYYENINKQKIDFFIFSQITTPFIKKKDFETTSSFFLKNNKFNSLISCRSFDINPIFWSFLEDSTGKVKTFSKKIKKEIEEHAQNKNIYIPNGGIYIIRRNKLKKSGTLYSNPIKIWVMDKNVSIDIDYEEDLILARKLAKKIGLSS
tara:strand:- start:648 stop:1358 length:711 start_codon:yes stop_codon:yes gene_type:complete